MPSKSDDDILNSFRAARDCQVILKETATSYIVQTDDGEKINIVTSLPGISVGSRGKVLASGDKYAFIREPYK